jgi:hypothetical protein
VALLVATCFLMGIRTARAEPDSAAESARLVERGILLRKDGRDAEALALFQQAYAIRKTPRTLAQIGTAEQALGQWTDAERDLLASLSDSVDPWIAKNKHFLEEALEVVRGHLGTLEVIGSPDGATVVVDGAPVGHIPAEVRLPEGDVVIRAEAPGYAATTRRARVSAREIARESFKLSLAEAPGTSSILPPAPPGAVSNPKADRLGDQTVTLIVEPARSRVRPWAWATSAVAAAGLAVGIAGTIIATGKKNDFNNHTGPDPSDPSAATPDCNLETLTPACRSIRDSYENAKTFAIIGYVTGGALAVTSAVLFFLSRHREPDRTAFACVPDPLSAGALCRLTF